MQFYEPPEHGVEIMVDLETMGTDPYSPIIAIGAVRFEAGPMQPMPPFYQAVKLDSCMALGLRPSASTIRWWMKQSAEARAVLEDRDAVALPDALDAFTAWLAARPDNLWGNSAAFDLGLLKDAYKACKLEVPWPFYREYCYRTLKGLPGMEQFKLERIGTHHNALDDAISQAHHCRDMLLSMKGFPAPSNFAPAPPAAEVIPTQPVTQDAGNDFATSGSVAATGGAVSIAASATDHDGEDGWKDLPSP